ncbi:LOW QUALITY PROTEIN: hypothetical protein V2J09_016490 [Rumex salicifolius]
MLKHFKTDVLALLEPQVSGYKAQTVCDGLGFSNNFRVEVVGASGGVWLLWNDCDTSVQIIDDAASFIHAKVDVSSVSYHLIVVYGPPTPVRRVQFWDELDRTIASISEPCFIGGDFNVIVSLSERQGGFGGLMPDSAVFSDLISRRELIDMGFSGSKFTWRRGPADAPTVSKRLDRCLMNIPARIVWDEDARDISATAGLSALRDDLLVWNKDKFGNVFAKKDERRRNRISALKDSAKNWVTDSDMLESMVVDYFVELFTLPVADRDMVCSPKKVGGLGLKSMQESNLAILGKLGWRLLNSHASLWGDVLIAKYGLVVQSKINSGCSFGWRSIKSRLVNMVHRGARWNVGNGRLIRFWTDCWVDNRPLLEQALGTIDNDGLRAIVSDMWSGQSGWKWYLFEDLLPATILMRISAVCINDSPNMGDVLSWAYSSDGNYSLRSGYDMLRPNVVLDSELIKLLQLVWHIPVSERIRHFLWLGIHGRLMTNDERARKHITMNTKCSACGASSESLIHRLSEGVDYMVYVYEPKTDE